MYLIPTLGETLPQTLHEIPDGPEGIRQTLKAMRGLARAGSQSPQVRQIVQVLTRDLKQKEWLGEITRIHEFVRDHIRYIRDPSGTELLQTPEATLQLGSGDCDDKSSLTAAMLLSIGHPARFVAIGPAPGLFKHVFVETRIARNGSGPQWIPLETTENWPAGKGPVNYRSRMTVDA